MTVPLRISMRSILERDMKHKFFIHLFAILFSVMASTHVVGAPTVEKFEIEGLTSAASPEALSAGLESKIQVKVLDLNLKNTESGWPVLSVEFDSSQMSRADIEKTIATIEDPAGHKYRVHKGPPFNNVALTDEELKAMTALGPTAAEIPAITSPIASSEESLGRGKNVFETNCATCHALSGSGQGPAAPGIATFPRQLWAWYNTDSSTDGYLYWFITNGRNEMPPWGIVLSENERWDVINYIKTLKQPE